MRKVLVRFIVAGGLVVLSAPAAAQSTRRPDLGLFGRGVRDTSQALNLTAGFGATFYDVLKPDVLVDRTGQPIPSRSGGMIGSLGLSYGVNVGSFNFGGSLSSFATYYPRLVDPFQARYFPAANAGAGWAWDLSSKTTMTVAMNLNFRPRYFAAVQPGSFQITGFDQRVDQSPFLPPEALSQSGTHLSAGASVGVQHRLSQRITLTGAYGYVDDWSFGDFADFDRATQHVGLGMQFGITRHLSLRTGYRYARTRYHDSSMQPFDQHSAMLGVDYNRGVTLQLSRNTTLALAGGVSGYTDENRHNRFRLTGSADLAHDIGRTWSSGVGYSRGVDSQDILFQQPVLYDRVHASLNGLVTPRIGAYAVARFEAAAVGFASVGTQSRRAGASTGLQIALTRHLSASVNYTFYYYRFGQQVLVPGFGPTSASQGLSAFVSLRAPLFQRTRRTNASR
jgi:opacity protein-like surface antigen